MSESLIEKKAETGTSSGTESGETTPTLAQRPDELPEKFWDVEAGAPRVDAMAKSYAALESRLSEMVKFPGDDADPADMASQAGVAFSINHIAAVVIPAAFGFLWLISPSYVFLAGAAMSVLSLILVRLIPENPSHENVALIGPYRLSVNAAQ